MKTALTDAGVMRLGPGTYFDTRTAAFGIRIGRHRRTWIVTRGKDRRVVTLGHYPALSLKEARAKAFAAFSTAATERAQVAFPQAREEYLKQDRWRPQSKRVLTSSLRHFSWTMQVSKILPRHVAEALDCIDGSSARAHALKDIRAFFNWCIPRYLASSPTFGLKAGRQASRDRTLSDDELGAVWAATNLVGEPSGALIKMLILTGQRCGEMGQLRGEDVSRDRLHLSGEVTKNGHEHWVPATEYLRSLLPQRSGLLFMNKANEPFSNFRNVHQRLLKLSGTGGWTLHDLRRTFATGLARKGTPIHVTERLLNHRSGTLSGIAAVYQRYDFWDEQVVAIRQWEETVLALTSSPIDRVDTVPTRSLTRQ